MKGFTLIELLVVVLIIGILTAIALPQYELVVEKSRASEAMINVKAIYDAMQRHEQEFPGDVVTNKSQIADVTLKGGTWNAEGTCFYTKNFVYMLSGGEDGNIGVYRVNNPSGCTTTNSLYYFSYYKPTDGVGTQICQSPDDNYELVCRLFENI